MIATLIFDRVVGIIIVIASLIGLRINCIRNRSR